MKIGYARVSTQDQNLNIQLQEFVLEEHILQKGALQANKYHEILRYPFQQREGLLAKNPALHLGIR